MYRQLDTNGDYTFGKGGGNFWKNVPDAVAQAVLTRLKLFKGEWHLDTTAGTPYEDQIIGMGAVATFDAAIKNVILNTPGVNSIVNYVSGFNPSTRAVAIALIIDTPYGQATIAPTILAQMNSGLLDIDFTLDSSLLSN
jgi:hypothetical protein